MGLNTIEGRVVKIFPRACRTLQGVEEMVEVTIAIKNGPVGDNRTFYVTGSPEEFRDCFNGRDVCVQDTVAAHDSSYHLVRVDGIPYRQLGRVVVDFFCWNDPTKTYRGEYYTD